MAHPEDIIDHGTTDLSDVKLDFLSDDELSQTLSADHWENMSCGHDCCTCNSECK